MIGRLIAKIILGLVLLMPFAARAEQSSEDRGAILIVSSYNPDTRRMSNFISEFENRIVDSGIPYDIYIENLECRGVADAQVWMRQLDNVIARYEPQNLKAIVLLGQEAWASFITLGRCPEGVQFYGCFASENGVFLPAGVFDSKTWTPQSMDFTAAARTISDGGGGGVLNRYDIKRNIDLILLLYPEVSHLAFVSDNTYGGISLQALVKKEMHNYPTLKRELIDSRGGDSLAKATYAALPPTSAVMIGTWRVGRDGQYQMQRSLNDLVHENPSVPVFSVTRSGIGDVAIGGYVPKYEDETQEIADQIIKSYRTKSIGEQSFHIAGSEYLFDSRKLKEWKIAEYALPKGSEIVDTMAVQLSKYSHYIDLLIACVVVMMLLLVFVAVLFLRTRQMKKMLESREGELVIARERAEESDMLKSAFLANMSHEIRTPLNAIIGFSSLMQTEELTQEERSEYCSIVLNNSEMLLMLLNDILDISSLECGKIKFSFSSENIVEICQHVMLTTAHTRQEGVEMRFNPPCESFMLYTDAHRLSQILINLLTNAGKFTSEGSITLAFEVRAQQKKILFSVTDTGPGIPLDKQGLVFNRFEKLEGKKKGTGLGLAICRQIAVIFGGDIWVDPGYTAGARFMFSHPIQDEPNRSSGEQHREGGGDFNGSVQPGELEINEQGLLRKNGSRGI